ncbi:hypothetical protein N7513_010324 [Penicillium frequentans]|nr:hypothetical protein N7513_010324 [Penicillium glabrum]
MFTRCRSPGKFTETRHDASSDPPSHNSNHAKASFLSNGSSRGRKINEMMQLETVENGVSDADVREVHAG